MILEHETILHNRYRIQENLGQGGMGSVYRAVDENLSVDVAVKENLFTTEEYARQFRLEAVILANIRHPNLPRVSDHFVIAGEGQYLVMDFIEGEDLRQRMERLGVLPEDEVILIGAAICDALSYLHARKPPILHRDIKPGNVKISPDGHIFLVDFGLAKIMQGNQATTTGARAMTPGYSPPEQYGTARTDARTDIYSLGATLYAALTGVIPEDGLARAMDNAQLTPLRKRNPDVTRRLAAAIERAMEVDPADRFQNADEFKLAMLNSKSKTQQLLGTYTIAPPPSEAERKSDPVKSVNIIKHSSASLEDQEFVSPRKKLLERNRRNMRAVIGAVLAISFIVFLGIILFAPDVMPESVRKLFPFLPPVEPTIVPTEIVSVPPTPMAVENTDPTATLEPTPVQVETPTSVVDQTIEPTPIGADYLQIAYVSTRTGLPQIYLTNILTDQAIAVTNMAGGACQPAWAPDGNRLVFTSPCGVKKDAYPEASLFIINPDGTGLQPLPTALGGDFEPAWSPDGKFIAFTSLRDGYMQIYAYDVENDRVQRLVETDPTTSARQPAWSPDGRQLVYSLKRVATYELWLMSSLGSNERMLFTSGNVFSNQYPVWTPDGKFILFSQRSAEEVIFPDLFSHKLGENSDTALKLPLSVRSVEDVDYSPGSFWIAYESGGDRGYHVYYSTPAGGNLARITEDVTFDDFDPAWRPIQTAP
ncbi:protein kinase [Candidatus Villigracilis affinis]|uniref:protein kinase domain-containing protein n=1 Tax=Candidatus Villigracilis affinis TaxID=3140682 RepID=UPI002A20C684|nr:protein kinase [Anaerolineales bacterium]